MELGERSLVRGNYCSNSKLRHSRNKGDHQHDQKLVANDVLSVMNSPDMENKPKVIGVNVYLESLTCP